MHGIKRVIIFCLLTAALPITLLVIPLYLRHNLYADVVYAVTESDILEMSDGVSTIFCSAQTLKMNGTFNAFQMGHRPEITSRRKHLRLKKSMTLPDDTLEYWGFYLLRGATVALSVCSRFPGASILVVKGERSLSTCGMLDHNQNKARTTGIYMPQANEQVKITFESNAQFVGYEEPTKTVTNPNDTLLSKLSEKSRKIKERKSSTSQPKHEENRKNEESMKLEKSTTLSDNMEKYEDRKNSTRKLRHARKYGNKKNHDRQRHNGENEKSRNSRIERSVQNSANEENFANEEKLMSLERQLNDVGQDEGGEEGEYLAEGRQYAHPRYRRNQEPVKPPALLDHGIQHGGNALRNSSESSVSSFEEGLLNCYEGQVLLAQEFEPSELCTNVSYLVNGTYMQTRHEVAENGYYYYIFYSDNDIVFNDIHSVFDIIKPTFQYENVTKSCLNETDCTFPLTMLSNDRVIVEVPTKDGIDHEEDDISLLVSVCHPRMAMYTIFPVAILFLIISCAFI